MTTIASTVNNVPSPIVVTPREGFNIIEHPMWKDYPSDDDEEEPPHIIHDLDTSDDEYEPLTMADLDTSEQPQPLTLDDLDTSEQPLTLADLDTSDQSLIEDLDLSGINVDNDDNPIVNLNTVFDDEYDSDIIDPNLTDNSESYREDNDEEEEYAQRDDIEEDQDYIEFLNMNRIMENKETITKPIWRYRQDLIDFELFKCTCNYNADTTNEREIDIAANCACECFLEPEGLFALAIMHKNMGDTYYRHKKQLKAEVEYEMAIALSPYNAPCYLDYAQIQETCHDDNQKAEQAYVKAIENHENVLAMYNLAGLHLRIFNDGESETESLDNAIKYYCMASEYDDIVSCNMVCILLYNNYPKKVEELAYYFNKLGPNTKHYYTADGKMFDSLIEEIGAINLYERFKAAPHGIYTSKCIVELSSYRSVVQYINKVALFTRLNHVTECGICYEEKLNIDLQCGHTTCTDCYKRVHMNECPFCRFTFH